MNVNTAANFRKNGKHLSMSKNKILEKCGYYTMKEITMTSNVLFIYYFCNISDDSRMVITEV